MDFEWVLAEKMCQLILFYDRMIHMFSVWFIFVLFIVVVL